MCRRIPTGLALVSVLAAWVSAPFAPVFAQSVQATLVGHVVDEQARFVPDALVSATSEETSQVRSVRTSGEGSFTLSHLPPGRYRLAVEAAGFRTFVETGIVLEAAEVRRVAPRLQVGSVRQEVTVVAPAGRVNTDSMLKSELVTSRLAGELPLNGRNYMDLAVLAPGVYHRVGPEEQGDGLSASGARADSASFSLDGGVNRADRNATPGLTVPVEAIREFEIQTSTYPAGTGRTGGAQVSVVTRSGSNRFSGSVSDYIRDDALDARNLFAPPGEEPDLRRQQGTATLGGPIQRNRLFFFSAYERLHERRSLSANTTAPSEAWLQGDFRNVRGAGPDRVWGNADDTNRLVDPFTRKEFPTPNVIPAAMIDATARQMLPYVPAANLAGVVDGYAAGGLSSDDRHTVVERIDAYLPGGQLLSGRWAGAWDDSYDPFPAQRNFYPGFGRTSTVDQHAVSVSLTSPLGRAWVNDARVGYFRQQSDTAGEKAGTDYVAAFGLPASTEDPAYWGFPSIRIDGFAEFGDRANDPSSYTLQNLQFANVLSATSARHTVKAGVEVVSSRYDELDIRNIRGDFRFRGRSTNPANQPSSGFRAFADFMLGLPEQTQRQVGAEPARLTGWQGGIFVQDEWTVSTALTLNLGLRYDRQAPLAERSNRLANFVPELGKVVLAGDPAFPPELVRADRHNVAPRAGFAWRPFADSRTVVRGGAGVYYSLEGFNVTRQQLGVSYPFVQREQYSRQGNNPRSLTFANPYPPAQASVQGINQPLGMAVDYQSPEYYHYNVTVERQVSGDLVVELGYVGSQGRHLGRRYNLNQPIATAKADGSIASVRPFPAFADIQFQDQTIESAYNALQASARRRLSGGLTLLASYTLSRATDTGSVSTGNLSNVSTSGSQKTPQNIYDMAAERGPADFDRTHQFTAAFAWDLPFGTGRRYLASAPTAVTVLASGWQVSGIVTLLSGRAFTPQYSAGDFAAQRPDLVGDPYANVPDGSGYNPAAFSKPVASASNPGAYGSAGRNSLRGPAFHNVDMAISRSIGLPGRLNLQFRAEAFNLLNHANYQVPVFLLDRSDAGRYTATANNAREWQLAVRLSF